ncbi:MAG TPA: YdeI/OmpD-associated family protein [Myxococcaceae bacterium]|nr:YdeI/OmpD-associated family protein [Myxococcaceae bacterium]
MALSKSTGAGRTPAPETPARFPGPQAWHAWLQRHHATSPGVWLALAKKGSGVPSVTYAQAIEVALAWGWIDGQKQKLSDEAWLQRFTPRTARSPWSKINRGKAAALIESGKMEAPGLAEVERARRDGRWDAAYDSAKVASVPRDLEDALAANSRAAAFFEGIDAANRYAVLWRVQTAKRPETRAKRIALYVAMCERGETLHSPKKKRS